MTNLEYIISNIQECCKSKCMGIYEYNSPIKSCKTCVFYKFCNGKKEDAIKWLLSETIIEVEE